MILKPFGTGLGILLLSWPSLAANYSVFTQNRALVVSEPVAIKEAYSGWHGTFYGGRYAFADLQTEVGFGVNNWQLSVLNRYHYDLQFNRDTAQFYYNTENKIKSNKLYQLKLDAQVFKAQGIKLSHYFVAQNLSIRPSFTLYRSDYYQFAKVRGQATDQNGLSVSSRLDYYYHQDLILEDPKQGQAGVGKSLDIEFGYQYENWQFNLTLADLFSQWYYQDTAATYGCINLAGNAAPVCDYGDSTGRSALEDEQVRHSETLPFTLTANVVYSAANLSLNWLSFQDYRRLGVQKDWHSEHLSFGLSAYSSKQLGLHLQGYGLAIDVLSDQLAYAKARELQLQLGWAYSW